MKKPVRVVEITEEEEKIYNEIISLEHKKKQMGDLSKMFDALPFKPKTKRVKN